MKKMSALSEFTSEFLSLCPEIEQLENTKGKKGNIHLYVYETTEGLPIGFEFDKKTLVSAWVRQDDIDVSLLSDIKYDEKIWDPGTIRESSKSPWRSEGDLSMKRTGANSNLESNAWPSFQEHDLICFKAKKPREVIRVVGELLRSA
ncbi:hypothetical protein [Sneathiella sp.]|jgi:hypothetical protein|uniref:hypothetical protein n=1 Tax=Sneathiella sp. TaxID=1964365 RepID=UPI0039E6E289